MTAQRAFGADEYLNSSAMVKMAAEFNSLATGQSQVPKQSVKTRLREQITDAEVLAYHDLMVDRTGPLFTHFLASVPCILEELSRVGVAITRFVRELSKYEPRTYTFYEVDAFDGSNGRTLAAHAAGSIKTLTSSPNKGNQPYFDKFADPILSCFHAESFMRVTQNCVKQKVGFPEFATGFDFIYETAAFQFYGKEREEQIGHVAKLLRPDGLVFFLEKLNHPDMNVYERREAAKDDLHKSHYFTREEIEWKRKQMLTQMHDGQVLLEDLVSAIKGHFTHVFLLWNSTNFYELVASNDASRIGQFMATIGDPVIPVEFCFESPVMRRLD